MGYYIRVLSTSQEAVWQFSDSVSGPWWMGVLQGGEWKHFQMELGDHQHREAFFQGEIPKGATTA